MHKLVNGQLVELTAEEISQREAEEAAWQAGAFDRAMNDLRIQRNRLLAATDWTQLADVTFTAEEETAWRDYRQSLRDLPAGLTTADEVKAVEYPTAP